MKISTSHQQFANHLGNQRALEHPEEFLGPNWKDVLNFWIFLDTLTEEQWEIIEERYCALDHYWALDEAFRIASYWAAYNVAIEATNENVVKCVYSATTYFSTLLATRELIGSHILKSQDKSLVFLPLFLLNVLYSKN